MKERKIDNLTFYYRADSSDEKLLAESKNTNKAFVFLPEYFHQPHDVIIDVGAHIGMFSLFAATYVPGCTVYAFEACRSTFELLEKNVSENNFSNIHCFHLALDDHSGSTMLYYNTKDGNWGHTISKDFNGGGELVPAETLEKFLVNKHIDTCHYIKFNCEGAEFNILLATPKPILSRFRVMMIQYHLDLAENHSLEKLMLHLKEANFSLRFFKKRKKRGWLIARNKNYPLTLRQFFVLQYRIFITHLKRIPDWVSNHTKTVLSKITPP